jgi:hypothetical protein
LESGQTFLATKLLAAASSERIERAAQATERIKKSFVG